MHRPHALVWSIAFAVLAGCASSPPSPDKSASTAATESATPVVNAPPVAVSSAFATNNQPLNTVQLGASAATHTVDLTAHADDVWDRIRMGFAIPNMDSPLVVEQQAWFLSHQDFLQRAVERSSHYLYHVVEELAKRGMPSELALLPFIESAYNPMAYSRAHASGMWQFIPATGKNFNLRQDWWRDERRDVVASTDAALNYLDVLYQMHGDWTLALASYNWGEGSVKRAIEKNLAQGKPTDYLSLAMPDETRTYYPKLQALKNIIANPGAFGLMLPRIDNEPYFVAVPRTRDMDLQTAARLANMPLEDFKALNPSYNRPVISSSPTAMLLLPRDRVAIFQANLDGNVQPLVTWEAYTVRRGDRLDRIALHFGMSLNTLRDANSLGPRDRARPGQALLVQRHPGSHAPATLEAAVTNLPAPAQSPVIHASYVMPRSVVERATHYTVRSGDTLFALARRFDTSVEAIKRENRLTRDAVAVGQKLVIGGSDETALAAPVARR